MLPNFEKFESNPGNIVLALDHMFKEFQSVQDEINIKIADAREQMRKDFAQLKKSIDEAVEKEVPEDRVERAESVMKVTNNNGNVQAYREITVNGNTQYQKGVPIYNGNIMWMNCPDGEIDAAREYLAVHAKKEIEAPKKTTDRVKFDDADFEERINSLLEGEHFLDADDKEKDDEEPTASELNELDAIEEENAREEVVAVKEESAPKSGRFVLDPETGRFVFRKA